MKTIAELSEMIEEYVLNMHIPYQIARKRVCKHTDPLPNITYHPKRLGTILVPDTIHNHVWKYTHPRPLT